MKVCCVTRWIASVLWLGLCFAGCGNSSDDKWTADRPPTYPVRGKVLYKGEPVTDANVSLTSTGSTPVGASGRTDGEGEFVLTTYDSGDGAVAGEHKVSVIKAVVEGEDPSYFDENSPNYGKEPPPATTKYLVPEKYSKFDTSGLTATVNPEEKNVITLELTD